MFIPGKASTGPGVWAPVPCPLMPHSLAVRLSSVNDEDSLRSLAILTCFLFDSKPRMPQLCRGGG